MNYCDGDNLFGAILIGDAGTGPVGPLPEDIRFVLRTTSATQSSAFASALDQGCTHLIVLPGGGQFQDDIAPLIASSRLDPSAMILGCWPVSSIGWRQKLTATILYLETGKRLGRADGPRVYPIALIDVIGLNRRDDMSGTEAVVRSAWAGCGIIDVTVPGSSHCSREELLPSTILLHARLLARAVGGWPHRKYGPRAPRRHRHKVLADLWRWCNPLHAWRELRQGGASRNEMAMAVAVGVFIANTPTYGFQLLIALHAARSLNLHPAAVVAGSKASTPPIGPILIASAVWLGHLILHGSVLKWSNLRPSHGGIWHNAGPILLDWIVGALVIGTATSVIAFCVASFLFRFVQRKDQTPATGKPISDSSTPAVQS